MTTSRNDPCPCGSGRKYKKCCLVQDQKSAAEQRANQQESLLSEPLGPNAFYSDLDELSNKANDAIRAGQWNEAEGLCQRLREEFPEELDADDRLAQLYVKQKNYAKALPYALAALDKAKCNPDKFDPELVAVLSEHVEFITRQTGF